MRAIPVSEKYRGIESDGIVWAPWFYRLVKLFLLYYFLAIYSDCHLLVNIED